MQGSETVSITWMLIAIQLAGLGVAWGARLSEGSAHQGVAQLLFFALLTLVGGVTIFALWIGPGCWLACGVTFALMLLTATCDFRRGRREVAW
jgi:hypothetical protein